MYPFISEQPPLSATIEPRRQHHDRANGVGQHHQQDSTTTSIRTPPRRLVLLAPLLWVGTDQLPTPVYSIDVYGPCSQQQDDSISPYRPTDGWQWADHQHRRQVGHARVHESLLSSSNGRSGTSPVDWIAPNSAPADGACPRCGQYDVFAHHTSDRSALPS